MRTEELLALGVSNSESRIGARIAMLLTRCRGASPRASGARVAASVAVMIDLVIAGSLAPRWIAFAQAKPAIEDASIKPSAFDTRGRSIFRSPGGRFTASNAPLRDLVQNAYGVQDIQISGSAGWVVGKIGPKFNQPNTGEGHSDTGFRTSAANGPVTARTFLIADFAKILPGISGDSTAIHATPPADANGSFLFTALQEPLGLRLESTKGPVEILVIDHLERPDAN
jgi:hypothetical protein